MIRSLSILLLTIACAWTQTNYFAVTAVDRAGLESDYSVEVKAVAGRRVALAWDANSPADWVVKYRVYWGPASRKYTNHVEVATNFAEVVWKGWDLVLLTSTNLAGSNWVADRVLMSVTNGPTRFYKLEWR